MRLSAILIGLMMGVAYALSCAITLGKPVEDVPVKDQVAVDPTTQRPAIVIRVPLPITLGSSQQVQQKLQKFLTQAPTNKDRAVAVLEFETSLQRTGAGSDFWACSSLANFLTSAEMKRIETVAYIRPINRQSKAAVRGKLQGHAVLVAIAANNIAMDRETTLGSIAASDKVSGEIAELGYRSIAEKRLARMPVEVVVSMLTKSSGLYRVKTRNGIQWVDEQERDRLEAADPTAESTTIAPAGELADLTSEQLHQYRMIQFITDNKSDLARQLNVPVKSLTVEALGDEAWKATSIEMPSFLDDRSARWLKRSVIPAMTKSKSNLLILKFNDCAGDPNASVKAARFIAELDPAKIRTAAVIEKSASSGAGLVALACDQTLMKNDATIGGFGAKPSPDEPPAGSISPARHRSYELDAKSIGSEKEKDWSILMAMIDAETRVGRYRNNQSGQKRLLSKPEHEELADTDDWKLQGQLDTKKGIPATTARQEGLSTMTFGTFDEVQAFYQLNEPPSPLVKTETDRWVESLAMFLTRPGVPFMLLLAGYFCISTEMSAPGLGVPGFLGAICFTAYFWSQFFNGNAEWFEVLLFVVGGVFIIIEVFVIPGVGIFGFGGVIMMAVGIVLSAQSFIIPQNYRQLEQLPMSLFPLIGAGFGLVSAVLILPKILPNTPFLRGIILSPPAREETGLEERGDREATADFSHLNGQVGQAVTKLRPSGRAKFGNRVYDVITQGLVIDKGTKLKVVEAVANRVVVEAVEEDEAAKDIQSEGKA
jgi:membrane-bound ClpP family serine protease